MNSSTYDSEELVFSTLSNCPLVDGPIVLTQGTWNEHIKRNHPEVSEHIESIEETILKPTYVAASKEGPGGIHTRNLVFVNANVQLREAGRSVLHVFVELRAESNQVGSSWFSRGYHGNVLWTTQHLDVDNA